jgi:hypothetical protein
MNKDTLKSLLKPVLKECLEEILAEQGLLKVLAEAQIAETPKVEPKKQEMRRHIEKLIDKTPQVVKNAVNETQQRMQKELKSAGLLTNSFDPFAGTKPLTEAQAAGVAPAGPLSSVDPSDKGVDISGIMNMAAGKWKAHMGGKGK